MLDDEKGRAQPIKRVNLFNISHIAFSACKQVLKGLRGYDKVVPIEWNYIFDYVNIYKRFKSEITPFLVITMALVY